jgi:outer membrane protein TolC
MRNETALLTLFVLTLPLGAQQSLSLREAVQLALRQNQSIEAAQSLVKSSEAHTLSARSGYLPTLDYSESVNRSDNPVFVFSSLLGQRQFAASNFAIGLLNRPNALDNFQSALVARQTIFDGGRTRNAIAGGYALEGVAAASAQRTELDVTRDAVRCYLDVILSQATLKAAQQAVNSAQADLERAESIHQAGMSTDADVLSIRVHLARMHEEEIRRNADLAIASAALNDVLGLPLDSTHDLTTRLTRSTPRTETLPEAQQHAVKTRPEELMMQSATNSALAQVAQQRSALFPVVSVEAAFEADRQTFLTRGGANYTLAASLNWNLFAGFRDKEAIAEAREKLLSAKAIQGRATSAVRLEVFRAWEELKASDQRIEVGEASVAEAEESLRITRNRYESGLSTVTALLRTETAVLESQTQRLSALHDQRLAALQLDLADGRFTADSPALKD